MTLEQAKQSAPPVRYFGETQFIVSEPDDCEIITAFGAMGDEVNKVNGKRVLCSRSFVPTGYSTNHQSTWRDHESG